MSNQRIDKVQLEQLIDQYLMKNIPLSLLIDSYNLDYPQMKLLINRVKGFSRQTQNLSETYENFNYEDVAEDYLSIPHIFTEEYPLKHKEQMDLFKRLAELKPQIEKLEQFDIQELESKIALLKDKLASYDQVAIGNIKDFVTECNQLASKGIIINEEECFKLLLKNHIPPNESHTLNQLYEEYLNTQSELLKSERELEIRLSSLKDLKKINREYEDIRDSLVVHNVKLVNWCIRTFFNNIPIQKEEAQAFGLEGLVKAINSFDYTKGFHFSTYAVVVIVRHIQRYFKELYGLKWEDYTRKNAIKYYRKLMMEIDPSRTTEPTPQELADMGLISLSVSKITASDKLLDPTIPFSEAYDDYEDGHPHTRAYEMPMTQEEYSDYDEYEDRTSIPVEPDYDEEIINQTLSNNLHLALESLTPREAEIIKYRYGFCDDRIYTLEEVAKIYNVTRERIRQIEGKALRKLRHPSRSRNLRAYIDVYDSHHSGYNTTTYESKDDKKYGKLRSLVDSGVSKEGMIVFMKMNGIEWSIEDLEREIDLLYSIKEKIIDLAIQGLSISAIRNKIFDDFFKTFSNLFIMEIIRLNQERLDPDVVKNLLSPDEPDGIKKL